MKGYEILTITYEFGKSLYVNVTNRCSNSCDFCLRNNHDEVNGKDPLWLEREPSVDEIKNDFLNRDLNKYDGVVFCGFGEPFERFYDCIEVAKWLKENYPDINIRVNTNGHANLIFKKDVTPLMKGLIDVVSISLNAPDKKRYDEICRSEFGEDAFDGLIDFAKKAKIYVEKVILSIVDINLSKNDILICSEIAKKCGAEFRVREYIK